MPHEGLRDRVEAVAGVKLPHGLLSLSSVVSVDSVHEELGVDWQPLACGVASTTGWCPPDTGDPALEKVFSGIPSETVAPVTAYAGVDCSAVGWTFDEGIVRVRSILDVGEQVALETWVWENVIIPGAVDGSAEPGDASVVGRVAALEAALAGVYGGVGVLHVPVILSAYMQASGLLVKEGARLLTSTGHNVVIGAGYPSTTDGSTVMAITGPVRVRQGAIETVPRTNHEALVAVGGEFTNDRRVLAERTSVIMIECGIFSTTVERTCCGVTSVDS